MSSFVSKLLLRREAWRVLVVLVVTVAALALPASKAAAQPAILNTHTPISFPLLTNVCTGEAFAASGFSHLRVTLTLVPNFHASIEQHFEGVRGIAAITGARYVVPFEEAAQAIIDSDAAPMSVTRENTLQFIRQAEDGSLVMGDDFFVHVTSHITVNANGVVSVFFSEPTITCR
jgi:hypothetical protein